MNYFDQQAPAFPLTSVAEYRLLAKKRLPKPLFEFIDGGAFNETTTKSNREDYQRIQFRKRILKDVAHISTNTTVLGQQLSQPLILAPVGYAGMYARRGEVQAARAAEKAGVPFSLSTVSICSIDEVRKATTAPFWYQLYMLKDRGLVKELLTRAQAADCPVLLLTVDLPAVGLRHRYSRSLRPTSLKGIPFINTLSQFWEYATHLNWFMNVRLQGGPLVLGDIASAIPHISDLPTMRKWVNSQLNPSLTWKDLEWIRANWSGKIVLKGIMDQEDATIAADSGVDGVVVSNHGGRHFDHSPSTISVLSTIVQKVGKHVDVLVDGGITSGLDVVKALACGARACLIGRSWAFALAARGEEGVGEVLSLFQKELQVAMAQLGTSSIQDIDSSVLI